MNRKNVFTRILCALAILVLSIPAIPAPVSYAQNLASQNSLAVGIYQGLTDLTPDEPARAWLATHKTRGDLLALTDYLLWLGYGAGNYPQQATRLYTTLTGFTPDDAARAWLVTHHTAQDVLGLTDYLVWLLWKPPVQSPSVSHNCDPSVISVPVLMYHEIMPPGVAPWAEWHTWYDEFAAQMKWFGDNGFSTVTADELYGFMTTGRIRNPRSVMLIFDDSYLYPSVAERVLPLMRQYCFTATLSLDTNLVYESASRAFTWDELRAWEREGVANVQSHSVSHPLSPSLAQLSDQALRYELEHSKAVMEAQLGKTVNGFITPGGSVDDRVLQFARAAGYQTFYLLWEKGGMRYGDDPFQIYRVNMKSDVTFAQFVDKMERYATPKNACSSASTDPNASLFERNHLVAYYGVPGYPVRGVLG